ncbi:3-oxo-tetronate kinase [Salmonella enterica]|uniref:3-oxo-tetronate kinase n=1 Tax=Salmonella enterica TaxID=28901 RepID=UPI002ACD60B2|nr:3-oxo-tetronate kinase [Salmonella enterica]WQG00222.1 3-oxo-tetronate kinase [Salmonella enterica subsp. enterica serovar Abortusovis]WQG04630.1 3-oxo-tetronate kinase [Salmonella enterica subsp. enterica serovar Abortusovis]WQG09094.1 3-oxo-tetronate kinase [Salmonella enterica subsp. enterica serovar Abortusovis]WQG13593.1 3-oxo-tetronate kinase [Salmonella enterica subsp. enterica serovar Abortusovis]HCT0245626.1 3-oxo-tetronate kinase [Salmonella enterica subsp. enterica serovar Abortu
MLKIGVIADDFTGATDIASFLVENGMPTVQINDVPTGTQPEGCDAVVISLKTRSCPAQEAIKQSLAALVWLKKQGCQQVYFKYCSTFDSTAEGNIGPVTDALMVALDTSFTVISPALPVNGRTVYQGYLFVMNHLLAESGMRHHPINPMTDSYLPRLMEAQAQGRCGVIPAQTLDEGVAATRAALSRLQQEGYRYAVLDALNERHLEIQGEVLRDAPLVTGGSGLAMGLARQWEKHGVSQARSAGYPLSGRAVVLSGSCSQMTNQQVAFYRQHAPTRDVDVARCLSSETREAYAEALAQWVLSQDSELAPMISATASTQALAAIQQQYGATEASHAVEALFSLLAARLAEGGITRFIVAGGETSGVVTQSLGITGFHIGPCISPGVPWVNALHAPVSLALKSGNFGDESFFIRAQREFQV